MFALHHERNPFMRGNAMNNLPLPPPPAPRDDAQCRTDAEHLNLLSVFHLIWGLLSAAGLLAVWGHYLLFRALFQHFPDTLPGPKPEALPGPLPVKVDVNMEGFPFPKDGQIHFPKGIFETILQSIYIVGAVSLVVCAVLNLLTWRSLKARHGRTLTLVTAGLNCLFMPLGTVLGIFTFIVLLRPSVKELYAQQPR
jgi:hypothetical protein